MVRAAIAVVLVGLVALGCRHEPAPPPRIPPPHVPTAKESYDRGMAALSVSSWDSAASLFVYTRDRFPATEYGVLAEIRLADANLGRLKLADAIDGYRAFIDHHPDHELVTSGYATTQIYEAARRLQELHADH